MVEVGFTGTRAGMTPAQVRTLRRVLRTLFEATLHHGDCVGADVHAHALAREMGVRVIVHPPSDDRLRAHCVGDETRDPLPYLVRNARIVRESDVLVACPDGPERRRSGTWSTIRMARRIGTPVAVIRPDGSIERRC